jgi:hypothetical protein
MENLFDLRKESIKTKISVFELKSMSSFTTLKLATLGGGN